MKLIRKPNVSWSTVFAAAMFGLLLMEFLRLIVPIRAQDLYNAYGSATMFIMVGVYFARRPSDAPLEIKIYIIYLVWALITRLIYRDLYLFIDQSLIVTMLYSFLFLCVGTVLSERQREIFLDALCLLFIAFFTLAALAGIFVCITDTYIHVLPENVWISLIKGWELNNLNMLSTVRLYSVTWFFLTWCLLAYQLVKRKKAVVRLLIVICMAIMHITITLFHSRNIQLCLSGCCGMLMLLIFAGRLNKRPLKIRAAALSAITVASIALCFFSFTPCLSLISSVRSAAAPEFKAYYESLENKLDPDFFGIAPVSEYYEMKVAKNAAASATTPTEQNDSATEQNDPPAETIDFTDQRTISSNKSMTGRLDIWKSGLIAVKENHMIALFGTLSSRMMPLVNDILHTRSGAIAVQTMAHMHNAYMQVLLLFGIPGLLLVILWTLLMAKKMLLVFFSDDGRFTAAEKALVIPLAGLFVFNLAEVIIFAGLSGISGYTFYIISGLFLGCFYEKAKGRRDN